MRRTAFIMAFGALGMAACGDSDPGPTDFPPRASGPDPVARPGFCAEPDYPAVAVTRSSIVNGTIEPSAVPLTRRQREAVVAIWAVDLGALVCSGALLSPTTVLTAAHCVDDFALEARFGEEAKQPDRRISVERSATHPNEDVAILHLAEAVADDITPLPVGGDGLGTEATLELAGFGQREDGFDERRFVASPIERLTSERIVVGGNGRQGLCFGDSGGPALWLSTRTSRVEVVGVLSAGDSTCVDDDRYVRLSRVREFIDAQVPDAPQSYPPVCEDGLTAEGACTADGSLRICDAAGSSIEPCPRGTTCRWSSEGGRFACVDENLSACGDVTQLGRCDGDVLQWCDSGAFKSRDCGACGGTCRAIDGRGAFGCADRECAALPTSGRCASDVVEYCDAEGRLRQLDCRTIGHVCRDDGGTARCVVPAGICDSIGFEGTCVDNTAVYCQDGSLRWENCTSLGTSCGFIDETVGYFCRD